MLEQTHPATFQQCKSMLSTICAVLAPVQVLDVEHRMLEEIFPRHVLEAMALDTRRAVPQPQLVGSRDTRAVMEVLQQRTCERVHGLFQIRVVIPSVVVSVRSPFLICCLLCMLCTAVRACK